MNTTTRNLFSTIGLAVLVALAPGCIEAFHITPSSNAEPSAEEPPEEVANVGDKVTVGNGEWTVLKVKVLGNELRSKSPLSEAKVSANGKFIAVKYQVTNLGTGEIKGIIAPSIDDGAGRRHSPLDSFDLFRTTYYDHTADFSDRLRPGLPETFVAIYEVPKDATGFQMEVGTLLSWSDNAELELRKDMPEPHKWIFDIYGMNPKLADLETKRVDLGI